MNNEKNNTDAFYLIGRVNLITLLSVLAALGLVLTWALQHYF
jgi:uncharacterized membrane protein YciS (DUF1049 family)